MRRRTTIRKEAIILGSYNLHGVQENDSWRFQEIAGELAFHRIDICGFQEVVRGNGIEDTSFQIARHIHKLTGDYYWTYWAYCHPFFDLYPEGISILSKYPIENPRVLDLKASLSNGARPILPRFALSAEFSVKGRRILFVTTHLDHHPDQKLRTAQASVLLRLLERQILSGKFNGIIITGDLNARENSQALRFFKRRGFRDTYRQIHRQDGNTFPSCNPMERIDYILKKGRIRIADSYNILRKESLSDHLGVVTVLR